MPDDCAAVMAHNHPDTNALDVPPQTNAPDVPPHTNALDVPPHTNAPDVEVRTGTESPQEWSAEVGSGRCNDATAAHETCTMEEPGCQPSSPSSQLRPGDCAAAMAKNLPDEPQHNDPSARSAEDRADFNSWEMEGFEWPARAATDQESAAAEQVKGEARKAIDPLTAAKRRRTTTAGEGGLAPRANTDSACDAGDTLPPTVSKEPQAFGLEDEPQTSGLAANGGIAPPSPTPHSEPTSDESDGDMLSQWLEESMDLEEARNAAASSGQEPVQESDDICTKCGHEIGSQECCRGKRNMPNKGGEECAAKRMRIIVKSAGCQTCEGPCQHQCTHRPNDDEHEHQAELDELNQGGNWRHRKARNEALKQAAVRQREIPTMENAQTEAQRKMAAMAAKFRK